MSATYPVMAGKYAQGQCPQIDSCASELSSCSSQYSSGNDKEDCQEGSQAICYAAADSCLQSAAAKCGEVEKLCPGPAVLLLALLGLGYASIRSRN